jgi:hypothetical protein
MSNYESGPMSTNMVGRTEPLGPDDEGDPPAGEGTPESNGQDPNK